MKRLVKPQYLVEPQHTEGRFEGGQGSVEWGHQLQGYIIT